MIRIEHLKKAYEKVTPLEDVSVEIKQGDIISVIGPSGTGKSTLLRCLNLLEKPTSGKIFLNDEEITAKDCQIHLIRRKMGMVFQSFNLFNNQNVIENIMSAPVELLGEDPQTAYEEAMELLRSVGLAEKAFSFPDELSGGQKQRVAIVRALAMKPEILLFDEPTSALDPTMIGEVLSTIRNLAKQGMTMIIVTHEIQFAKDVSNRVFYMDQGGIYEDGSPDQIFNHPKKELTRQFIFHLNVLEHTITKKSYDYLKASTQIEEFGRKHLMDQKQILKIISLFEEICVQTVLPKLSDDSKLHLKLEYSEQTGETSVILEWQGDKFNPIVEGDEFPITIAKENSKKMDYSFNEDGEYKNAFFAEI